MPHVPPAAGELWAVEVCAPCVRMKIGSEPCCCATDNISCWPFIVDATESQGSSSRAAARHSDLRSWCDDEMVEVEESTLLGRNAVADRPYVSKYFTLN